LKQLAAAFPVVVVSGARQVGKTTLLRHLFPSHDYVVFDPSVDIENARREPELFLDNHRPPLILDEIQYAPELVAAIKRRVDSNVGVNGQYLLTGSQQWQVLKSLTESLAGRCVFLDLYGFSLAELGDCDSGWLQHWLDDSAGIEDLGKNFRQLDIELRDWLWRGSLPRATQLELGVIPDFWAGYHRTYVERDARLLGNIGDWQEFGRFVRLMGALTACELNFSQLGREIGMTPQSARRWLKIMEGTYQWHQLPAFSGNPVKRVSARPKGYFVDTGLVCHYAQISSPHALVSHPLFGALFETAVANDLLKQASTFTAGTVFHHWRTAGGAEVDLVVEKDGVLFPLEIKLTASPTRAHASGLEAFRKAHRHRPVAPGALICASKTVRWLTKEVMIIPWNCLAA